MRFFQVPARRWWWGLLAVLSYVGIYFVVMIISTIIWMLIDPSSVKDLVNTDGAMVTTPGVFLVNNLMVATDVLVCPLIAWLFYRQGFGWLVSVVGRFRWKWAALTLGVFAAGYAVEMAIEVAVTGPKDYGLYDLHWQTSTWFMLFAILLTTPFQCAGEEFQARALLPRLVAAIVPVKGLSLALSALVPSVVFMLLHDAQDPWLNLNYFCVALLMWWLAYRTGGIEASIALHLVNNLFSEWMLPFTNISDMFDRSQGTGSPIVLVYIGVELVLVLLVDYIARRRGVIRASSPAAAAPQVVKPRRFFDPLDGCTQAATDVDLPRWATTTREGQFVLAGAPGYGPVPQAYPWPAPGYAGLAPEPVQQAYPWAPQGYAGPASEPAPQTYPWPAPEPAPQTYPWPTPDPMQRQADPTTSEGVL